LWQEWIKGGTENPASILFHTRACTHPSESRAWLTPVLLKHHWYLLAFDWVDRHIRIYDSLSVGWSSLGPLIQFGRAFVGIISSEFGFKDEDWTILPEQVRIFLWFQDMSNTQN
jgi:hypothetical protein